MKPHLALVQPIPDFRSVRPRRGLNIEYRQREHLTPSEVEALTMAVKGNRYGHRDATMILTCYRHGLRVSELCKLEWASIDLDTATMHIRRAKRGKPATHPIRGDEQRALRQLQREQEPKSAYVFTNERGSPFLPDGFASLIRRAGEKAGLGFKSHPHQLRHACGFAMANAGDDARVIQDYLGHASITNTAKYTELSATKFRNVWR